jgi:hypothetical protein
MSRTVRAERNSLTWKVRRVWVPEAVRPIGPRQMYSGSARPTQHAGLGVLLSPLIALTFAVPVLLVLLPLRLAKLSSWRVEAVARPWGRRGPAHVLAWRVKGWKEGSRAIHEIAAALERGETSPQISSAKRDE